MKKKLIKLANGKHNNPARHTCTNCLKLWLAYKTKIKSNGSGLGKYRFQTHPDDSNPEYFMCPKCYEDDDVWVWEYSSEFLLYLLDCMTETANENNEVF